MSAVAKGTAAGGRLFVLLTLGMLPFVAMGCGHSKKARWGDLPDESKAVSLARALQTYDPSNSQIVTVSGRITEVCKVSGCWFVLQESSEGRERQIYVDLTHGATFTVPPDVQGRLAVVKGRIIGRDPDLKFYADGLLLQ